MKNLFKDFDIITNFLILLLIIVTTILAVVVTFLCVDYFSPGAVNKFCANIEYEVIKPIQNPDYHEIYDNVYVDKELDTETEELYQKKFSVYLSDLPLYKYDYKIILTNEDLSGNIPDYAKGHDIVAITDSTHKVIKLKYEKFEYSILHEIGHAVDRYENYSQTEEFQALYNRIEHDTYYTCDAREYFAYCYSFYVVDALDDVQVKAYFDQLVYGYSFVIGG